MIYKQCTKCKGIKLIHNFCKNKNTKDKINSICRLCQKEYDKQPHILKKKNNYAKAYYQKNKEKRKLYTKEYERKNKEKIAKRKRDYFLNNKEERNKYLRDYRKRRRAKDICFKINENFSRSIRQALQGLKNGYHWESLVDYTLDDLINHLESLWEPWMNWNNYGVYKVNEPKRWQIDHIIPKSWFNYTSPEDPEFKECWALSNLQPKEGKANITKRNKFIG